MKKLFFSLAALLVVVFAAVTVSSCSKDEGSTHPYVVYEFYLDNLSDEVFPKEATSQFDAMFLGLGAKSMGSDYYQFTANGSELDATVKKACETVQVELEKHVTIMDDPCNVVVKRILTNNEQTDVTVYSHQYWWQ